MGEGIQPLAKIAELAIRLREAARASNHRRALLLSGERSWCRTAAEKVIAGAGLNDVVWLSDSAPGEQQQIIRGSAAHKVLGREIDAAIVDAYAGFDPEALGAVAGAVRGGGLLILLTPRLDEWPDFADPENNRIAVFPHEPAGISGRYLARLVEVIRTDDRLVLVEQDRGLPSPPAEQVSAAVSYRGEGIYRTGDQQQAVEAIIRVVTGHRRRPVVLTSDRGRGKSAALGIAAAQLLSQSHKLIIVTAPRLDAVEPLFEQAGRLLPQARVSRGALHFNDAEIRFLPPDRLVHDKPVADLVLVDEAAAIPTPLLAQMLEHHARIAFATTVHGYEGTGRGFTLRFRKVLDRRTPDWKSLRLETPIRWAPGDPVERFVFQALMLDAVPVPGDFVTGATPEACSLERLDRDRLAVDEPFLRELFGLLVLAHYRTSPLDLRHLLDGPNVEVYAMGYQGHAIACALVAREGGIDACLAHEVYLGNRRVQGHLVPQSLAVHGGMEHAPELTGDRIMRIAVHPAAQGRGLGTRLLQAVVAQAQINSMDYVGSSFGVTRGLLRFWFQSEFLPVRLGLTREAASGTHSVICLKPLTEAGNGLFESARGRFLSHFPHLLSDPLRDLEADLAVALLQNDSVGKGIALSQQDWADLHSFAFGKRGYEVCMVAIWHLVAAVLADATGQKLLDGQEQALVVYKVLQKKGWQQVAKALELSGHAESVSLMRQVMQRLLGYYGDKNRGDPGRN